MEWRRAPGANAVAHARAIANAEIRETAIAARLDVPSAPAGHAGGGGGSPSVLAQEPRIAPKSELPIAAASFNVTHAILSALLPESVQPLQILEAERAPHLLEQRERQDRVRAEAEVARQPAAEERARALEPRRHVRAVVAAPRAGAEELGARSRNAESGSYLEFLPLEELPNVTRLISDITKRPNQKLP